MDSKQPRNYSMAVGSGESLRKRLNKDETLKKRYSEVKQGYIEKGYAELALRDSEKKNGRE